MPRKSTLLFPARNKFGPHTLTFTSSDWIAALDGATVIKGGWVNGHWVQFGYQLADSVAGFSYSFVMTCVILFIMNLIPGLSLRVSAEDEELGLDDTQLGEFAYDYVEITRSLGELVTNSPGSTADQHSLKAESPEKTV